jgi:hypothetical protein
MAVEALLPVITRAAAVPFTPTWVGFGVLGEFKPERVKKHLTLYVSYDIQNVIK